MSHKKLLLFVWNRDISTTPGGLSSLSHAVDANKVTMHLFKFTNEPMLYFYRELELANEILELCDTAVWNTDFGHCKCTSLPIDTIQEPEDYLIEGLKEKGIEVIKRIQS